MKGKVATIIIVISTLILAVIAIFTAIRLYQLRNVSVSPNVPESQPAAVDTVSRCKPLSFAVACAATPTPTPTPTPTAEPTEEPTPTPTPEPTATPTPTAGATATAVPTPTRTPIATSTSVAQTTPLPVPATGLNWPSILGIGVGIGAIILSIIIAL